MDSEEVHTETKVTCTPTVKVTRSSNSVILEASVSSSYKCFHALTTFASRPELLIPNIRSTDLEWESIPLALRQSNNQYDSQSLFEFVYAPIFNEGKYSPSNFIGELFGSLNKETFTSWSDPNSDLETVTIRRMIHHKPVKDSLCGWTSTNLEIWDFKSGLVEVSPMHDESSVASRVPFPTFKAQCFADKCIVTLMPYPGVSEAENAQSIDFYERVVFPKLFEWMSDQYVPGLPKLTRQRARPIIHVSNSKYWHFYDLIKSGPAEYIKSIWQESTDPVKFIHEDIGIAAYIASFIYEDNSTKYRSFNNTKCIDILDLGCGNGLLCFFLSEIFRKYSEISDVTGFDIRRRKLWPALLEKSAKTERENNSPGNELGNDDFNPTPMKKSNLRLLERSIVPHLMDDLIVQYGCSTDDRKNRSLWLIGNHSDELTPWIPVLARRMNANGFFNIPCCPFDFFQKYQRKANIPGTSTYQNYIEYICTIGDKFGYQPTLENLRIPSTKKICLVGLDCRSKFADGVLDGHVDELLKRLKDGDEGHTLAKFVPRKENFQKSHNVDRSVAGSIVEKIFHLLVKDWKESSSSGWYSGRDDVTFRDVMAVLSAEDRETLKKKGNGLRTIVKSNRYLFTFDNDRIRLRIPQKQEWATANDSKRDKIKTKECYFHRYHPQRCPLTEEECCYKH